MQQAIINHQNKIRFGFVGCINTAIDFGVLFFLTGLGLDKYLANYASTLAAFIFSFFANRKFTFKSKDSVRKQIIPFTLVTLSSAWILQPVVIWSVLQIINSSNESMDLFIAKTIATTSALVFNYLMFSRVVFKHRSHQST